ncbi:MAG: hypothetical protein IKR59_00745 [Lachnospiraceae bacterium]|nr:hypothetical protein [Lachnospiraceae bacterium]
MFTLEKDRLRVSIAEPNVENNTCRFNRAGFITSVILDGTYEFCGDEHGGTMGAGLCSEITTDVISKDAAVGEKFPKFGVGLLTKIDEHPYIFMRTYEVDPFEIRAEAGEDSVTFYTEPRELCGYALREKKTVSIHDNVLAVDYEVENAGSLEFEYSEYCHNFLTLDFEGVRNSYNLNMQMGNAGFPYEWRLMFSPGATVITGREYFVPHHHNIWSPGFVISPEVFFVKTLAPGEKASYRREYEFDKLRWRR